MEYIQITESNREIILELFSKMIDQDGYIIEKKTGIRLTCPYSNQYIHASNFSILPGTATFVNNKSYCFAEHIVSKIHADS